MVGPGRELSPRSGFAGGAQALGARVLFSISVLRELAGPLPRALEARLGAVARARGAFLTGTEHGRGEVEDALGLIGSGVVHAGPTPATGRLLL